MPIHIWYTNTGYRSICSKLPRHRLSLSVLVDKVTMAYCINCSLKRAGNQLHHCTNIASDAIYKRRTAIISRRHMVEFESLAVKFVSPPSSFVTVLIHRPPWQYSTAERGELSDAFVQLPLSGQMFSVLCDGELTTRATIGNINIQHVRLK